MKCVNRVTILGNAVADPELRSTGTTMVCKLRVATNERFKDKNGEQQERTEFHRVTLWGPMGEACAKYVKKGEPVYVEGRIETQEYEKNGEKRCSTEIRAFDVVFLGGKRSEGQSSGDEGLAF